MKNPSPAETKTEQPKQSSIQKIDTAQTRQEIQCNDRGQPEGKVLIAEINRSPNMVSACEMIKGDFYYREKQTKKRS